MTSSITFVYMRDHYQIQLTNLHNKAQSLTELIAYSIDQQDNKQTLGQLFEHAIQDKDVNFVVLQDSSQQILGQAGDFNNSSHQISRIELPIETDKLSQAKLILGISRARLDQEYSNDLQQMFAITALIVGALVFVIYLDFLHFVITPLRTLSNGVAKVRNGDLNVHLEERYDDELGALTKSFNDMVNKLKQTIEEKDKLTHELALSNRSLELRIQESACIMRDLHDDVGANLLTLVHRCKTKENMEIARKALQNLRETIRGLGKNDTQIHLGDALAAWQEECKQRLEAANIEMQWSQEEPHDISLNNRQTINLGRIIREAISNSIKHSGSNKVTIENRCYADSLQIRIKDFGNRKPPDTWEHGTGINSIRTRAAELNAPVSWYQNDNSGTTMEIACPLASTT